MSLIQEALESCTMLDKTTASNGMGGYTITYVDGAEFEAAIVKDKTLQARIAEKQGVTETYTVSVYGGLVLDFHDVFRRDEDGAIFRVTSYIKDSTPPKSASAVMQFGQVTAERWQIE